jgi:hypothetical protein
MATLQVWWTPSPIALPGVGRATTTLFRLSAWCCRRCGKLSYQSQNEGDLARAEARVNARRRKLDPADLGYKHLGRNEMPVRPNGMWQRTYQRLLADSPFPCGK